MPTIFPNPEASLGGSTILHTVVFLFLMFNALGNYIMTIKYPAESANETVVPVCSPHCSDKVDAHYLLNGRHFCKLCKKVIFKRDHHCFFTGNCIGNRNMRYFIMFCIYTSCTCLYSLVLGVAFLTVEYSISFENPLTFLTLLPLSTGYFFMGELFDTCNLRWSFKINALLRISFLPNQEQSQACSSSWCWCYMCGWALAWCAQASVASRYCWWLEDRPGVRCRRGSLWRIAAPGEPTSRMFLGPAGFLALSCLCRQWRCALKTQMHINRTEW